MEVLVAIFILSIGLLSIMAFFPLGALNMAQSVKDDRTASIAANADAMGRIQWRKAYLAFDSSVNGDPVPYNFLEPGLHALDYPIPYGRAAFPLAWAPPGPAVLTPAERMAVDATLYPFGSPFTPADPSTPVLFDPIGFVNQSFNGPTYQRSVAGLEFPVGGVPLAVVPRRSFSDTQYYPTAFGFAPFTAYPPPTALQASIRTSALLDDMSFDLSGQPTNSGGQIDRGGRYNVAWLFQRPKQSARAEANMTILVFNSRPLSDVAAWAHSLRG